MQGKVNPAIASMLKTMLGIDPEQLVAIAKDAADKLDSFDKRMNILLEQQQHILELLEKEQQIPSAFGNALEEVKHV